MNQKVSKQNNTSNQTYVLMHQIVSKLKGTLKIFELTLKIENLKY